MGPPTSMGESDLLGVGLVVEFCNLYWKKTKDLLNVRGNYRGHTLTLVTMFHRYFQNTTGGSYYLTEVDQFRNPFVDSMEAHSNFGHLHLLSHHRQ